MHICKHTAWSAAAEAALADTLGEDRDAIVAGVEAGRLELWEIERGQAWLVTCVDAESRELIVCCLAGRGMAAVADVLYRTAQGQGLRGVRFFTARRAMARALRSYPLKLLGYVYRCEVANVAQ
ncbi:hypothetical protein JM946_12635 [Steroidobacter sp. S1-65]|uniref:N-acetyltransferase domain-containing protein n=1 Tax=Steroidobacter gossypii TaxID=2805490 RepID=A0ABS1WXB6_9GAMM|nr:hypothetical protein [Steroidobacter gossypii]MBM0105605.1 hypothetical protein [Steroidobacter gossypii]